MKTNYRHTKKLKEQARLARQAEKLQRRAGGKAMESETPAGERTAAAEQATEVSIVRDH